MSRPPFFPMMIDLWGKRVLVVGGGRVAARRAETLVRCGAEVAAVSPEFCADFPEAARRIPRAFTPDDVSGDFSLVIAATDSREINSLVRTLASSLGIPVNVCDSQNECDFFFPSLSVPRESRQSSQKSSLTNCEKSGIHGLVSEFCCAIITRNHRLKIEDWCYVFFCSCLYAIIPSIQLLIKYCRGFTKFNMS